MFYFSFSKLTLCFSQGQNQGVREDFVDLGTANYSHDPYNEQGEFSSWFQILIMLRIGVRIVEFVE